jgi:lipoprotein NlpI
MRYFITAIAGVLLIAGVGTVPAASQYYADECRVSNPEGEIAGSTRVIRMAGEAIRDRVFAHSRPGIVCRSGSDGAVADDVELILFDPTAHRVYRNRGVAHPVRSYLGRSIARYSKIIMLDPKDDDAYFRRGIANFYAGSLPKALADISQASELDPKYAYYALWRDIIDRRSNRVSHLAPATAQFDMTKWPAPLVRLFLGQTTPAAVLAAADDRNGNTKKEQVCEANFYTGELALQRGAKEEAARLFRLAAADCPHDFVEGPAASAELMALGASL